MIPYLTINGEGLKRLSALASLTDKLFEKLVVALQNGLDSFSVRPAVLAYANKHVPDASEAFTLALEAVVPFLLNDEYAETSADDLLKGLFAAVGRNPKGDTVTPAQKRVIKARLKVLFNDPVTKLRAKTWSLVLERPCLFQDGRILTDLRPVFSDRSPTSLQACSVIHTLVINCQEDSASKTLHIALDTADLASLKLAIARAEQKQRLLTAFASKAGILSLQIK